MKKFDIKKIFKNFLSPFRRHPFDINQTPQRDWKFIFIFFIIINLISAGLNFYMFLRINNGDIFTASEVPDSALTNLDRKGLETVITTFTNRQQKMKEISSQTTSVPDPSL